MKIILVHITAELLKVFTFTLVVLTTILTIVGMVHTSMKEGILLGQIIFTAPYIMVEVSRISIPMTLLLATTICFAKMAGNNEIVALKSLGIPPWKVIWPVLALGVLVSLVSIWLSDWGVTWGRANLAKVLYAAGEDIMFSELRKNHLYTFRDGGVTITAEGVDKKRLLGATITLSKESTTIHAQEANLKFDLEKAELQIRLRYVEVERQNGIRYTATEDYHAIPLSEFGMEKDEVLRPADMGMKDIPADIERQTEVVASARRNHAATLAFSTMIGNFDPLASEKIWNTHRYVIDGASHRLERLRAEPPRRWASGFCCFFFVWLGAPLAIWMKKSDVFSSFFACFVPILLLYYPILMFGFSAAKNGTLPPECVWVANLFLGAVGIWFWRNIHRY